MGIFFTFPVSFTTKLERKKASRYFTGGLVGLPNNRLKFVLYSYILLQYYCFFIKYLVIRSFSPIFASYIKWNS